MRRFNIFRWGNPKASTKPPTADVTEIEASYRAWSGVAELRFHNHICHAIILLLLALLFWNDHSWREHADRLSEQQWIVFHERGGVTTATSASEYRTGPSDEEIKGVAWEVIRKIKGAGSKNVDDDYKDVRKYLAPQLRGAFDGTEGQSYRDSIRKLNIYRNIENAIVRQMEQKDLPPGSQIRLTRYDVIATGRVDTYRLNSKELINTGPFAYRLHLVPLEKRTVENTSGLVVAEMENWKIDQKAEDKSEKKGPENK